MTQRDAGSGLPPTDAVPIACRRLGRPMPVDDHRACPYCFGDATQIRSGAHACFCDYEAGTDPVCFGFPATFGRLANG